MSFLSFFFFIFILWEALASQRPLISRGMLPSRVEWDRVYPGSSHNREVGAILYGR